MNVLYKIEKKLPSISKTVTSKPLAIGQRALNELQFWKGKKETSSGVYSRLKDYWDNARLSNWTPSGTPWSAAFISYILKNEGFKGQASHYKYTKDVIDGVNPGWEAFSIPKNKNKLKVQVGDVLVKPRSGGEYNTHGDVVIKIGATRATLAGGNLSNTAKVAGTVSLNPDGTIRDAGKYLVLLKKNPVTKVDYGWSRILAYGGFAVAGILTVVLGVRLSRPKNEGSKSLSQQLQLVQTNESHPHGKVYRPKGASLSEKRGMPAGVYYVFDGYTMYRGGQPYKDRSMGWSYGEFEYPVYEYKILLE